MRYFISGHGDLTQQEFNEHYVHVLREACRDNASTFVIGDFRGADVMAQLFLARTIHPCRITVYHMSLFPRFCVDGAATIGGFRSDNERDKAMTHASDRDIAWVRPGREKSGTAKNLKRRKG